MLVVQCATCSKVGFAQNHQDPDGALECPCCTEPHDHAANANSCSGGHDGAECPTGADCLVVTAAGEDCPGGHCAKGVDGCTVCRPIVITIPPGSGPVLSPAGPVADAIDAARGF